MVLWPARNAAICGLNRIAQSQKREIAAAKEIVADPVRVDDDLIDGPESLGSGVGD